MPIKVGQTSEIFRKQNVIKLIRYNMLLAGLVLVYLTIFPVAVGSLLLVSFYIIS